MKSLSRSSASGMRGHGQQHRCRDRNKLERRTMQNMCLFNVSETQGVKSMFDLHPSCASDSPYETKMRSMVGVSDEWD